MGYKRLPPSAKQPGPERLIGGCLRRHHGPLAEPRRRGRLHRLGLPLAVPAVPLPLPRGSRGPGAAQHRAGAAQPLRAGAVGAGVSAVPLQHHRRLEAGRVHSLRRVLRRHPRGRDLHDLLLQLDWVYVHRQKRAFLQVLSEHELSFSRRALKLGGVININVNESLSFFSGRHLLILSLKLLVLLLQTSEFLLQLSLDVQMLPFESGLTRDGLDLLIGAENLHLVVQSLELLLFLRK